MKNTFNNARKSYNIGIKWAGGIKWARAWHRHFFLQFLRKHWLVIYLGLKLLIVKGSVIRNSFLIGHVSSMFFLKVYIGHKLRQLWVVDTLTSHILLCDRWSQRVHCLTLLQIELFNSFSVISYFISPIVSTFPKLGSCVWSNILSSTFSDVVLCFLLLCSGGFVCPSLGPELLKVVSRHVRQLTCPEGRPSFSKDSHSV